MNFPSDQLMLLQRVPQHFLITPRECAVRETDPRRLRRGMGCAVERFAVGREHDRARFVRNQPRAKVICMRAQHGRFAAALQHAIQQRADIDNEFGLTGHESMKLAGAGKVLIFKHERRFVFMPGKRAAQKVFFQSSDGRFAMLENIHE